jgi:bifunctional DNase/RNase
MKLRTIKINDTGDRQYITLGEDAGERSLTIVIGYNEVQAIHRFVNEIAMQRPMTHDLLVALAEGAAARIEQVSVTELKEGTFYAHIRLTRQDGSMVEVDARPSDAIALATAVKCPIFVAEDVLRDAAIL